MVEGDATALNSVEVARENENEPLTVARVAQVAQVAQVARRVLAKKRSTSFSQSSLLPPVETPPTKVLLAEPLSMRKLRLQRSSGKKRKADVEEGVEKGKERGGEQGVAVVKGGKKTRRTEDGNEPGDRRKVTRASKKKVEIDASDDAGAPTASGVDHPPASTVPSVATVPSVVTTSVVTTSVVSTGALTTTGKNREPPPSLADLPLDSEGWALKDIVKWGSARERRLAKENAKLAPKQPVVPQMAPMAPTQQASLTPKVRVIDGKIVVDEESLTVAAQQKEEYTKVVTEESHTINSMSYVNRLSNDRWSVEDTELFFRALSQFGTDFSLMAMLFPGRMRKHLKKKFCKESKVCPERIDAAMRASAHATLGSYREMIDLLKNSKEIIKNT